MESGSRRLQGEAFLSLACILHCLKFVMLNSSGSVAKFVYGSSCIDIALCRLFIEQIDSDAALEEKLFSKQKVLSPLITFRAN